MKVKLIDEFLNKVDRPWGMSMTELKQFQSEVKQLKSEQNKVAVEKLEELKLKLRKLEFQQISTFEAINSMIKELKGESDE